MPMASYQAFCKAMNMPSMEPLRGLNMSPKEIMAALYEKYDVAMSDETKTWIADEK